jgi:hypothetical protein
LTEVDEDFPMPVAWNDCEAMRLVAKLLGEFDRVGNRTWRAEDSWMGDNPY